MSRLMPNKFLRGKLGNIGRIDEQKLKERPNIGPSIFNKISWTVMCFSFACNGHFPYDFKNGYNLLKNTKNNAGKQ